MLIQFLFINPLLYLMFAAAILVAFSVHEYSHAQAAYLLGDPSAKMAGRLTINPLAHFDPVGTLLIFLVGIGWGKPVPFNPYNLKNQKYGPAIVGLSGPLSNFFMALFVGLVLRFVPFSNPYLIAFLSIFIWINLALGLFNLLPIFPLDGSHVLSAVLPGSLRNFDLLIQRNYFLFLIMAVFFMIYVGYPYIINSFFSLLTGMPSPF